jgi:predicted nucleic acid-binding protein
MILVDTGPLIALNDKRDSAHLASHRAAQKLKREPLVASWPCITEAIYFLGLSGGFALQATLWKMRQDGYLKIIDLSPAEVDLSESLMKRYQDLPMDLADATLVALAEFRGWKKVFTSDSHFFVYRLNDGGSLDVILPI